MKKLTQARLLKKYEALMKPIILKRDGNVCQIRGIGHVCYGTLRMDHRPCKRGKHSTFFDPRNLTTVCGNANFQAEHDPFVSDAILRVVVRREGDVIAELYTIGRTEKRWRADEIEEWIGKCEEYFKTKRKGLPQ